MRIEGWSFEESAALILDLQRAMVLNGLMTAKSSSLVVSSETHDSRNLAEIVRDVHENGFAVMPDFIDEDELNDLRQVRKVIDPKIVATQFFQGYMNFSRPSALAEQYITRCSSVIRSAIRYWMMPE